MLKNGQTFPTMTVAKVGGGTIHLPGDLAGSWSVVLIYRGAWCPLCREQLEEYEARRAELDGLGVKFVAFSVDDEATTSKLAADLHLSFPMGFGADADQVVATLGAAVNAEPHYVQPTDFILTPDGSVVNAMYSTNAMGRITAGEVIRMVSFINSQNKAA